MKRCINNFTEKEYEAIRYEGYRINESEIINTVREHLNIPIRVIMPKLLFSGLDTKNVETEMNEGDWLIRTITTGTPLYDVVTNDIMDSNFGMIN